ncbi:BamA/TamA family outer membrane protein [Pedobacter punctiformis]|uniref:Polymerase n=1 Tax=Pedobacter punctiformis TaxID=3004097 RepID=A0ABT4LBB2_9SPHI|nr:BamA/TamA family outer membrane protein [Pedobacter sp. HCMS5-2]MCZ4245202.1 polymerase [Pedobacter sp. HCMS5-2]
MKKIYVLFFLLVVSLPGMAQMKLIRKLLSEEKDTTRKASFMPIPVFGYAQETGFEFGLGALFSYYRDRKDTTNRSSNFSGTASYSTKKTYSVSLQGDAWSKGNIYHSIAEIRFKKMPFNFYGVGNNTDKVNEDKLVQQQFKIALDLEKTFIKNAYTGISLGFENYDFTDKVAGGIFTTDSQILGKQGGSVIFTGVSQSYDTRNSNNYPTKGFFGRITYQYAPDFFGGDNFNGSQITLNVRNFWKLGKKFVLGVQGMYNTIQSKNTPFYLLPQLGNDEMMRGYYSGRYRDENLLALQTELRYRYNNRFGAVLFAGTGTVWGKTDFDTDKFKPNLGAGLRYFFDPAKGLSVRLDYGIGEKLKNEKRQSGFYISLAEAF